MGIEQFQNSRFQKPHIYTGMLHMYSIMQVLQLAIICYHRYIFSTLPLETCWYFSNPFKPKKKEKHIKHNSNLSNHHTSCATPRLSRSTPKLDDPSLWSENGFSGCSSGCCCPSCGSNTSVLLAIMGVGKAGKRVFGEPRSRWLYMEYIKCMPPRNGRKSMGFHMGLCIYPENNWS